MDADNASISMHTNDLSRIDHGSHIEVAYVSNRSNAEPKFKSGEVILVELLDHDSGRFRFYDDTENRKIEVIVKDTLADSVVKSMKTQTWTTIGSPVRIVMAVSDDIGPHQSYVIHLREDDYTPVVSFAEIEWNRQIVRSLLE